MCLEAEFSHRKYALLYVVVTDTSEVIVNYYICRRQSVNLILKKKKHMHSSVITGPDITVIYEKQTGRYEVNNIFIMNW